MISVNSNQPEHYQLKKFLPICIVAMAVCSISWPLIPGAASGAAIQAQPVAHTAAAGKMDTPQLPDNPESAAAAISGSPWPGVIDHLLQRPLPDDSSPFAVDVHINYPSIGNKVVDADIRRWVTDIANAFESHLDMSRGSSHGDLDSYIDIISHADPLDPAPVPDENSRFELWGNYQISRPSDAALSVTFELWNYAGSPPGNLDIVTLNYNLLNSQRLTFVDIFEKPDVALELMSTWSRRSLELRFGPGSRLMDEGTAPTVENFSSLTLTPAGICINFQPYQVGPWDSGIQKVEMPLDELTPSFPLLALWGK